MDLGQYLGDKLRTLKPADKVVLHLHNAGKKELRFTPVAVPAGTSLVLYYDMKSDKPEERRPLRLLAVVLPGAPRPTPFCPSAAAG